MIALGGNKLFPRVGNSSRLLKFVCVYSCSDFEHTMKLMLKTNLNASVTDYDMEEK